jgi:tRNA A-37 threonylcarbamoyl transferase component Bud32
LRHDRNNTTGSFAARRKQYLRTIVEHISLKYPDHRWELVSKRSNRSIYRLLRGDAVEYYVKIYDPKSPLEKLRNRMKPRTLHEFRMLQQLQLSGLPVPEVKEHISIGNSTALLTRAVFPSKSLLEMKREDQIRIMLEMSVRLINHGYHFTDMHAGNIILDSRGKPYLVDAYEIIPCRKITLGRAAALLAQAGSDFHLSDEELDPYLLRVDGIKKIGMLRRKIRSLSLAFQKARVKRRVRRSFREGSFSLPLSTSSHRALVHRKYSPDLDGIIEAHCANVSKRRDLYKLQEKTQLSRVGGYCVKSYKKAWALMPPYARRSWKGLLTLLFNGVPVADPVAYVLLADGKSVLVTKALDHPDLDVFLWREYEQMTPARRHDVARALGLFIGNLHSRDIYHADLKACNIKVETDSLKFYLLDTDRVEQRWALSRGKKLRNLMQINTSIPRMVSRSVRMAFLEAYCSVTGYDARDLYRRIWRLSSASEIVYRCGAGDRIEEWSSARG